MTFVPHPLRSGVQLYPPTLYVKCCDQKKKKKKHANDSMCLQACPANTEAIKSYGVKYLLG